MASSLVPRTLIAHRDPARPIPSVTFADTHTLDAGGEKFVLSQVSGSRCSSMSRWSAGRPIAHSAMPVADFFPKVEPGNIWAALDLWFDPLAEKAESPTSEEADRPEIKIMTVAHRVDQPTDR